MNAIGDDENPDYYRRCAMRLRFRNEQPPAPEPPVVTFTPTTRAEDYSAIVDVYRMVEEDNETRREAVCSPLVCPIIPPQGVLKEQTDEEMIAVLRGANPYSATREEDGEFRAWQQLTASRNVNHRKATPYAFAAYDALGAPWTREITPPNVVKNTRIHNEAMRVDVTLLRRDTIQSVRVINDGRLDRFGIRGGEEVDLSMTNYMQIHLFNNEEGRTAGSMMFERGLDSILMNATIVLKPLLPTPGSDDEPAWLANCRQAVAEERLYRPSAEDLEELSNIENFEFGIKRVTFPFYAGLLAIDGENVPFSNDDLLIALEGLRWK